MRYVKHLGKEGLAKVEEEETNWFVTYIDRSQATLEKADHSRRRALLERTEEERERRDLEMQVASAQEGDPLVEEVPFELI